MFWLIFCLILLHGLTRLWLELLNFARLKENRGRVPEVFAGAVDAAEAARAEDYTRARIFFGLFPLAVNKGVILGILLFGGFPWLARLVEGAGLGPVLSGLLFFGILAFAGWVLSLPFEWYETFRLEERFGFNRTTYRLWIIDTAKGLALAVLLGGSLLVAVLLLLYGAGPFWWLFCWGFVLLFSLAVTALYPVLIAPLFNRFTPLKEGSLREKVIALMERAGIRPRGVFVMDAGKRSRHTNAYFTGFGRSKRIVLFDTLIEKHDEGEILAVLAHEAGHWKKKHVLKGFVLSQAVSFGLFAVTGALVAWPHLYEAFGFSKVTPFAGLLLASIAYGDWSWITAWGEDAGTNRQARGLAVQCDYHYRNTPCAIARGWYPGIPTDQPHTKVYLGYTKPGVVAEVGCPPFKTQKLLGMRALVSDTRIYVTWCQTHGHQPLPATPALMVFAMLALMTARRRRLL